MGTYKTQKHTYISDLRNLDFQYERMIPKEEKVLVNDFNRCY